jgi:glutamate synthase (NADH) large subunit (EC 1.4.1.14)
MIMSARACRAAASSSSRRAIPGIVPEESIIVGNTVMYGAIEANAISAASPANVSRSATPAPSPWSKARAITAANT